MSRIPFSIYDFFGYLASGLLFVTVLNHLFNWRPLDAPISAVEITLLLLAGYTLGQALASPASWILERVLVKRLLGSPAEHLLGLRASVPLLRSYSRPLPAAITTRIFERIGELGLEDDLPSAFLVAFSAAKEQAVTWQRLEQFQALYGFSRNLSFTLCLSAMLLASFRDYAAAAVGAALAVVLAGRYLKFHRLYAKETLLSLLVGTQWNSKSTM